MKGVQDRRHETKQDLQVLVPFPGCLGRMINMFDLSNGVVATKMLTEKAHRDGTYFSYPFLLFPGMGLYSSVRKVVLQRTSDAVQHTFAVSPAGRDRSNTFKTAINPPAQTEDKQVCR